MKPFLLASTLLLFSALTYGQTDTYDLSSYKLPDFKRQALDTRFSLDGASSMQKSPDWTNYDQQNYNSFGGNLQANYWIYENSAKLQRGLNAGFNISGDAYSYDYKDYQTDKHKYFSNQLYVNTSNRIYFADRMFYGIDGSYKHAQDFSKWDYDYTATSYTSSTKNNIIRESVYVPLKFGVGRIEEVQDARHAIYIYDELAKVSRTGAKTHADIEQLATLISELKNQRSLDARLKRIAELESVDSFLVANNFITASDGRYFATLVDMWDFGNQPMRQSGTRYAAIIAPGVNYQSQKGKEENPSSTTDYDLNVFLPTIAAGGEVVYEKPMSLSWQNSIYGNAMVNYGLGKTKDNINDVEADIKVPFYQLNFSQTFGYYPNTRTSIYLGYALNFKQHFDKSDDNGDIMSFEGKGLRGATNIGINYYFSPQLRLAFTDQLSYVWQDSDDHVNFTYGDMYGQNILSYFNDGTYITKNFQHNFNLSLVYSFF